MKIAPIIARMKDVPEFNPILLHTGQHYDDTMSKAFFVDLNLPEPDIYLGVGSGSHAKQTANIMIKFEEIILKERPDIVLLVGDVNSTIACSLVASKLQIPIAHVEAGLRSFDRSMPEEINRIVTDSLSDLLFTTCEDANENLKKEGIADHKIYFVGNVMIDTLLQHREKSQNSQIRGILGLNDKPYAVLTLHRPSNVDGREGLEPIFKALYELSKQIIIVFPVHLRTKENLTRFGYEQKMTSMKNLIMTNPLGYLDFLNLVTNSRFVMTDSGGLQEETTVLGIPCLTLRKNTERPVTILEGTNTIVGNDPDVILKEGLKILKDGGKKGRTPRLWDGKAAERIVDILSEYRIQNIEYRIQNIEYRIQNIEYRKEGCQY